MAASVQRVDHASPHDAGPGCIDDGFGGRIVAPSEATGPVSAEGSAAAAGGAAVCLGRSLAQSAESKCVLLAWPFMRLSSKLCGRGCGWLSHAEGDGSPLGRSGGLAGGQAPPGSCQAQRTFCVGRAPYFCFSFCEARAGRGELSGDFRARGTAKRCEASVH